jgi:hypothetical protein
MTGVAVALAVSLVRARDTSRGARPGDLEAYNAYLAGLARPDTATPDTAAKGAW